MNGDLHLGHLYTIMKTYVTANYESRNLDKKKYIPFGFHCTGMPLYSQMIKLRNGDKTVEDRLISSGVENIEDFKESDTWIRFFTERAISSLKSLQLDGWDSGSHMVTTDYNPYYDSFIQWQFRLLHSQGRLVKKKRPCIFSDQPCFAHDRSTGEDAKLVEVTVLKDRDGSVCGVYSKDPCYVKDIPYIVSCWEAQGKKNKIFLPDKKVISRTGITCIVADTEQWYINYSDPEWKNMVLHYIKNQLIVHDPAAKDQLLLAAKNLEDWCVSRECGLGTNLPCDPKFKIDSLSDSTIYWIYYNVVKDLHLDPYGKVPVNPGEDPYSIDWGKLLFTNNVRLNLLSSAKDLVNNHMVMALYNCYTISKDILPREYIVCGYLNINKTKMSKSSGKTILIKDIVDREATMVTLLLAGDGLEDANFQTSEVKSIRKKINKTEKILQTPSEDIEDRYDSVFNKERIRHCISHMKEAFKRRRFKDALEHGWLKILKIIPSVKSKENMEYAKTCVKYTLGTVFPENKLFSLTDYEKLLIFSVSPKQDMALLGLERWYTKNKALVLKGCHSVDRRIFEKHRNALEYLFPGVEFTPVENAIHEKRDIYKLRPS